MKARTHRAVVVDVIIIIAIYVVAPVGTAPGALASEPAPAPAPARAPSSDTAFAFQAGALRIVPLAQLRLRSEVVPDRTLNGETPDLALTHRARVGAKASLDVVDLVVRVQDVRTWGAERVPEGLPPDATIYGVAPDSFGLHEAYAALRVTDGVEARVGRQEIVLGNERLIGNADWLQRGRAFDALRILAGSGDASGSAFAALVFSEGETDTFAFLSGAFAELKLTPWSRVSPIFVYNARVGDAQHTATFGTRIDGAAGGFAYDIEAYGQTTRAPDARVSIGALGGARVSYRFDTVLQPKVGLLTDVVSGAPNANANAKPGDLAAFDTLFATNHKFYGFADMFTSLPLHTKGRGLVDNAASLSLTEGPWSLSSFVHVFTPFASVAGSAQTPVYGIEPDIIGTWKATNNITMDLGCALFVPVGTALGRGTQSSSWAYAQLNVQL